MRFRGIDFYSDYITSNSEKSNKCVLVSASTVRTPT